MRLSRFGFSVIALPFLSLSAVSAQTATPQEILAKSLAKHGLPLPGDVQASGSINVTEGSSTDSGQIRILVRGLDQTAEFLDLSQGKRSEVQSKDGGFLDRGRGKEDSTLEWTANGQSSYFPVFTIAAALANPDTVFEQVGVENIDGAKVIHIRFWNSYASQSKLKHLARFSEREIWIEASTGLPRKLGYDQREGSGAVPSIRVEFLYSDYRNVGGTLYPHSIEKGVNGTPWGSVRINSVSTNVGLTDDSFRIQ